MVAVIEKVSFTPKHQKLVNHCYPKGRSPDMKPNSSETSYLLFYVNSRRSKLEKVSTYLVKRTMVDLRHRRTGYICVTLELMDKIVNSCKENLDVFIKDFMHIMMQILSDSSTNNDTHVLELLISTFTSICKVMNGSITITDPNFLQSYETLLNSYFKVTTDIVHNEDLILKGCIAVAHTSSLASNQSLNHFIKEAVQHALTIFVSRYPKFSKTDLDIPIGPKISNRLSRTQTGTFTLKMVNETSHDDLDLSIKTLHLFFSTTETDKLYLSITELSLFLQDVKNKSLLEFIVDGIPVQLRYIVILIFIRQITSSHTEHLDPIVTLKYISSLLVSDVSIVGLSVLDIMRKLLHYQLSNKTKSTIVKQCVLTIRDLNGRIYYRGQTSDMLYELISKIDENNNKNISERVKKIVFDDIHALLKTVSKSTIDIQLYIELTRVLDDATLVDLFDNIESHLPSGYILSDLFNFIMNLKKKSDQATLMSKTFSQFNNNALISGLYYFYNPLTNNNISYPYYCFHNESSRFLKSEEYAKLSDSRSKDNKSITNEELLEIYQHSKLTNKVKQRANQILQPQKITLNNSNSNLLSNNDDNSTIIETESIVSEDIGNGVADRNIQPGVLPRSRPKASTNLASSIRSMMNTDQFSSQLHSDGSSKMNNFSSLRQNSQRMHSDSKSSKFIKTQARVPRVSDLKKAIHSKSNGRHDLQQIASGPQSVRSEVTNITFLLSELKSTENEMDSRLYDLSETERDGVNEMEKTRSKQSSILSKQMINSNKNNNRFSVHATNSNGEMSNTNISEEFQDAPNKFEFISTGGRLFG